MTKIIRKNGTKRFAQNERKNETSEFHQNVKKMPLNLIFDGLCANLFDFFEESTSFANGLDKSFDA